MKIHYKNDNCIKIKDMKSGDIGVIQENLCQSYEGTIVKLVKFITGAYYLFSLNEDIYWSDPFNTDFIIRLLKPGDMIEL